MARSRIRQVWWFSAALCGVWMPSSTLASHSLQRCICAPKLEVDQAVAKAEVVFLGRVLAPSAHSAHDEVAVDEKLFAPLRIWKGEGLGDQVIGVRASDDLAACGRQFERDQTYLIYARRVGEFLTDDGCSRSTLLANAADDLAALGEPIWLAADPNNPPVVASQRAAPPDVRPDPTKLSEEDRAPNGAEPPATAPLPRCAASRIVAGGTHTSSAWLVIAAVVALSARRRAPARSTAAKRESMR